jgi:hypothetical protein
VQFRQFRPRLSRRDDRANQIGTAISRQFPRPHRRRTRKRGDAPLLSCLYGPRSGLCQITKKAQGLGRSLRDMPCPITGASEWSGVRQKAGPAAPFPDRRNCADCRQNALPQSVNKQTMPLRDPGIRGMSDQRARAAGWRDRVRADPEVCLYRPLRGYHDKELDAAADTCRTAAQPPLQQIERASAGLCAFGGGSSLTVASGRRRNRDLKWRERPVLP